MTVSPTTAYAYILAAALNPPKPTATKPQPPIQKNPPLPVITQNQFKNENMSLPKLQGYSWNENKKLESGHILLATAFGLGVIGTITGALLQKRMIRKATVENIDKLTKSFKYNAAYAFGPLGLTVPWFIAEPKYKQGLNQIEQPKAAWKKSGNIKIATGLGIIGASLIPLAIILLSPQKRLKFITSPNLLTLALIEVGLSAGGLLGWMGIKDIQRGKGKTFAPNWPWAAS